MLECVELSKSFGGVHAVSDLTMSVPVEDIHGLVGANGSGKTTAFNLITGFLSPTKGRIFWEGRDITGRPPDAIANLGLVRTFQHANVFPGLTVRDSLFLIQLHHRKTIPTVDEMISECGLEESSSIIARDLSFGAQRRLGVALALMCEPRMLLLDEPAAGLNNLETQEMSTLLLSLSKRNVGILLIDHDMSFVMPLCVDISVMDQGSLLASGTPEEIANDERVIEKFLGSSA